MDWLKADRKEDLGLLVAPINSNRQEEFETEKNLEPVQDLDLTIEDIEKENTQEENITPDSINIDEDAADLSSEILELRDTVMQLQNSLTETEQAAANIQNQINENEIEINLDDEANIKRIWQEKAADFDLSLDEPPPELWGRISESDDEDDDEEIEYEQGVSLQGAAYVQKKREHGKNFTERLHNTLKWRKQKAEQLREEEEEKKDPHPYRSRSLIICSTMLMILGVIFLALFFIQNLTPEKLNARAMAKYESGDYEGAMNLYQRAYKRYPNVLTFLTGLANSAEKAGHIQTACAAWEAYINSLPKDDIKNKRLARRELKRINKETELKEEKKEEEIKTEEKEQVQEPQSNPANPEEENKEIKEPEPVIPVNFDDFLREGNNAYNLGMYNTAIIYFFRAAELNGSDVRSYIGLANSYKAKGMYFDAKRVFDEAKRKFKRNPTVENGLNELQNIN